MSNVAIFHNGQTPQYVKSVNTPDYVSDPDVIVNPDISSLAGVPVQYWKRSGNSVLEMSAQEKAAVDAAIQVIADAPVTKLNDLMGKIDLLTEKDRNKILYLAAAWFIRENPSVAAKFNITIAE